MKRGWLVYNKKDRKDNSDYIAWILDHAKKESLHLELILREDILIGIQENKRYLSYKGIEDLPDFAIVRTIDPLFSAHLEALGIQVFNNAKVAYIANNKGLTHHYVEQLNVPVVATIFTKKSHLHPENAPLEFPLVVKSARGRGGSEVYWISAIEEWQEMLRGSLADDLIIQETNVQIGKDLRVYVVGKQIIASVLRTSETDYRANFRLGGKAEVYELTDHEASLVMKIVNHFDFGMVGIDFLIGLDGELLFNEIEDIVGSRMLSALTDVNISYRYLKHINRCLHI